MTDIMSARYQTPALVHCAAMLPQLQLLMGRMQRILNPTEATPAVGQYVKPPSGIRASILSEESQGAIADSISGCCIKAVRLQAVLTLIHKVSFLGFYCNSYLDVSPNSLEFQFKTTE